MQINLPENLERSLLVEIQNGHFASVDDAMAEALRLLLRTASGEIEAASPDGSEPSTPGSKPIGEVLEEITASIPEEEWAKLPIDGGDRSTAFRWKRCGRKGSPKS